MTLKQTPIHFFKAENAGNGSIDFSRLEFIELAHSTDQANAIDVSIKGIRNLLTADLCECIETVIHSLFKGFQANHQQHLRQPHSDAL